MRYRRCLLLIGLLAVFAIATSVSAVDKGGGVLQRVGSDPTSTFTIGALTNVFPLDTVEVPLYLDTPNDPNYTQNRITWVAEDLTLLEVVPGDSVPDTGILTIEEQTTTEVQFNIWNGDNSLNVYADVPVAILRFEVLCFGYGASTDVEFVGGDDLNWYDSDGTPPLAPVREPGSVHIAAEQYQWVDGGRSYLKAGDTNIEWPVFFQQFTPGRLTDAVLTYDHTLLEVVSIVEEPGLGGGTVDIISNVDGVLTLELNGNPFIDPAETRMFTIYFDLLVPDDDFITFQWFTSATRENECGDVMQPTYLGGGWLRVVDHTAEADLYEIYPYRTASYYDVPVRMDSNYPINTFKLFVNFPADDIEFVQVVARSGYTAPIGGVNSQDPNEVIVTNSSGTNYELSGLTTVFYLRFAPLDTYPAGTQFDLSFDQVSEEPETEIRYLMDLGGYHNADITDLTPGYIRLRNPPPPPPPCCPALYTWNGREFQLDNNILAACDGKKVTSPVTEYYHVTGQVLQNGDELHFQVREDADAVSAFNNFELLVVDHPSGQPIQVTKDGQILTKGLAYRVSWARDHKGRDISELIRTRDDVVYQSTEDGWFDVSLGVLSKDQVANFASYENDSAEKSKLCDDDQLKSQGIDIKAGRKLKVSIKTADGGWQLISENDARHNPKQQASLIDPELIEPGRELVLRYSWESFYRTDAVEFYASAPYEGEIAKPELWDAVHSETGNVVARIGGNGTAAPLMLSSGEVIDLVFDASDLPRVARGNTRDYIFVTTGKYDEPGSAADAVPARGWALDANVPNPFNPSTTISYSLASESFVDLSIFDVRGALVRTLVSGRQTPGEKSVTWDGQSNSGNLLASGVYFYRLSTPEFAKTRKMILLK